MDELYWLLFLLLPLASFLYASVGHGGASSYLVLLTLFGFAPEHIRPTALILNMVVSLIAFLNYRRAEPFPTRLFMLLMFCSVPAAFLGGMLLIDSELYRKILGFLLLFPIVRFANILPIRTHEAPLGGQRWGIPLLGVGIGFVSGLIGIGGGIILSPILMLLGWASVRQTAAVSALFIFVNSFAGLLGAGITTLEVPSTLWTLLPFAISAGMLGAYLGAHRFGVGAIKKLLVAVLAVAAVKLLFA